MYLSLHYIVRMARFAWLPFLLCTFVFDSCTHATPRVSRHEVDFDDGAHLPPLDHASSIMKRSDSPSALLPRTIDEPLDPASARFHDFLMRLSSTPLQYESPRLINKALSTMPLEQLDSEAIAECQRQRNRASSSTDGTATWGYTDCVLRAMLRWFKQDFMKWVDSPQCSVCNSPTRPVGIATPSQQDRMNRAARVELYHCTAGNCNAFERFPRYNDVCALLQSRRGRCGEFANCFSALCRALGGRVRWVWSAEDHIWTEIWSETQQRWVHVDACEGAWDNPRLYTQGWGKKMSYCIGFSVDGAADVTNRYVRNPAQQGLPRDRTSEETLASILDAINQIRRMRYSEPKKQRLAAEEAKEADELCCYVHGASRPQAQGGNASAADARDLPARLTGTSEWRQLRGEGGSSAAPSSAEPGFTGP